MATPNFFLMYVDAPLISAKFYEQILDRKPVDASANFVMFALEGGVMLGLWARHDVQPSAGKHAPTSELALTVGSDDEVTKAHDGWKARGVSIAQPPTKMDFGFTFVGLDPDGHRVRVFAPAGP